MSIKYIDDDVIKHLNDHLKVNHLQIDAIETLNQKRGSLGSNP